MARRALSPARLRMVQAVAAMLPPHPVPTPGASRGSGPLVVRAGVSGGADSMALAGALAHWRARRPDLRFEALVVDHGLFAGSAEHTARVVARVRDLGLPATGVRVQVPGRGNVEDAARRARHDALWRTSLADGPGVPDEVWLAHTLDDQAETVLLGLARGSGLRSLAAMAARREHRTAQHAGHLVRPLLGLRRRDTEQACHDAGIEVWHDPANADARFRRSALRAALPYLGEVLGADPAMGLARTAHLARADADLLDQLAAEAATRVRLAARPGAAGVPALDAAALLGEPSALRGRVLHAWLREAGCCEVTHDAVQRVLALAEHWHGQGPVHLAGGVRVQRSDGLLWASDSR